MLLPKSKALQEAIDKQRALRGWGPARAGRSSGKGDVIVMLPQLRCPPQHRHSFQPYALLDDDGLPYYVGYRCECGEPGYVVP